MQKFVYNCETGEQAIRELTPEETATIDAERAARGQELADNARMRQALGEELGRRKPPAAGKKLGELSDRELLLVLLRERLGPLQDAGIFDASGVVQPQEEWRV